MANYPKRIKLVTKNEFAKQVANRFYEMVKEIDFFTNLCHNTETPIHAYQRLILECEELDKFLLKTMFDKQFNTLDKKDKAVILNAWENSLSKILKDKKNET